MPRPCNALPSACTSARRSQRSSRSWTRPSTAWLSGYARAKHSVSCSELSSLPLRQRAPPQARRSRSRSAAASGPKVSRSLASRRMARARWGTRRVLLTRASLFAGDAVLLHHAVEVVAIDAREARGFGHVVLCALEQVEHVPLLEGVAWRRRDRRQRARFTARPSFPEKGRQVLGPALTRSDSCGALPTPPVLPPTIAHTSLLALRDFRPVNVRFGSIASHRDVRDAPGMSAMPPIATQSVLAMKRRDVPKGDIRTAANFLIRSPRRRAPAADQAHSGQAPSRS